MTDDDLIGYVLNALPTGDRAEADAGGRADPAAAGKADRLRRTLALLGADREPPTPRPGLALRTIGRLAEYLVEHDRTPPPTPDPTFPARLAAEVAAALPAPVEPAPARLPLAPRERPEPRGGGRPRADVLVAAGIAFVACGLVLSGIGKARDYGRRLECQNAMRTLHVALAGYADAKDGHYPQARPAADPPTVAAFKDLGEAGQFPAGFTPACPSGVGYAYSLGYRGPDGQARGLRRSDLSCEEHDLVPIAADYPSAAAAPGPGPTSPHRNGMNVLYAGGNVRYATTGLVGLDGDDIYRNRSGRVAAGEDPRDTVLGRPGDTP